MRKAGQARPQQLPGPAHPACPGLEPQQAVSPGPGMRLLEGPDADECAESIFLRLPLWQWLQFGDSSAVPTKISLILPQSRHKKSNNGITFLRGVWIQKILIGPARHDQWLQPPLPV